MLGTSPRVHFIKKTPQVLARASVSRQNATAVKAEKTKDNVSSKSGLESLMKPIGLTTLSSLALALPAYAEAGKLFDFNLTLPIMAVQFLVLMVFLEKTWFTPVGNLLDRRDQVIRDQLANVSSRTDEIKKLEKEAEEILKKARMEAQAAINKSRAELEAKLAASNEEAKAKSDAEIAAAFATLEKEKEAALQSLESEVDTLANQILTTVLPQGISV